MFNVLPENLKEEIRKEYGFRRLLVIFIFILFTMVAFIVFLFPSWLVSTYKEKDMIGQMNSQKSSATSQNTNAMLQTINETNKRINVINTSFEYEKIAPVLNSIISAKSKSISLREFGYVSTGNSTAKLSVRGVSATREALVFFVKNLQSISSFSNVASPISNLAKDKNIDFVISLDSEEKNEKI